MSANNGSGRRQRQRLWEAIETERQRQSAWEAIVAALSKLEASDEGGGIVAIELARARDQLGAAREAQEVALLRYGEALR